VIELAWSAGFFDGEGCIVAQMYKSRPGRAPGLQLHLEQVDRRPLERFAAAVSCDLNITLRPAREASKPIHRISVGHAKTMQIMTELWPYLSEPKREQFLDRLDKIGQTFEIT
jgi:hypothetical protein